MCFTNISLWIYVHFCLTKTCYFSIKWVIKEWCKIPKICSQKDNTQKSQMTITKTIVYSQRCMSFFKILNRKKWLYYYLGPRSGFNNKKCIRERYIVVMVYCAFTVLLIYFQVFHIFIVGCSFIVVQSNQFFYLYTVFRYIN